jgi:hypothetical protein
VIWCCCTCTGGAGTKIGSGGGLVVAGYGCAKWDHEKDPDSALRQRVEADEKEEREGNLRSVWANAPHCGGYAPRLLLTQEEDPSSFGGRYRALDLPSQDEPSAALNASAGDECLPPMGYPALQIQPCPVVLRGKELSQRPVEGAATDAFQANIEDRNSMNGWVVEDKVIWALSRALQRGLCPSASAPR